MKVTRLPRDPGPAAWNRLLEDAPPPQPLGGRITADWLVIGAGFAGLAAARRLAQNNPKARIVVLDAVRIGDGPVGRNSGFMIDLPHVLTSENYAQAEEVDQTAIKANRAAIAFAMDAAQDYGLPSEAITLAGKINGAASARGASHNDAYAKHLTSLGEPFEVLDAKRMREVTGSAYYQGGLYTPGVAMLQPAMFARGVAAGLASNRVQIHENSPVTSLSQSGDDWVAETPNGAVTAPKVILAVNGHAESFGHFKGRLMHVVLYASMTRALHPDEITALGGEPTWGITPSDPMGSTIRRIAGTGGHRIIVRNRCTFAPDLEIPPDQVARMARDHDRAFRARFPMLRGVEMEHRWGGRLCLSLNDAPAFGEVQPGIVAACCQNGLGAAKGTLNGIAAADLSSGRETAELLYQQAQPEPKRLWPGPLMRLGAPATIRWRELSAGAEL